MSQWAVRILSALLLAGALLALGMLLHATRQQNQLLQDQLSQAQAELQGRDSLLTRYRQRSAHNAELAAQQQATLTTLTRRLQERSTRLHQLERVNEALRNWAATALPEPVIRLRQRPAITGAAAYRDWLSAGDALPAAGSEPPP